MTIATALEKQRKEQRRLPQAPTPEQFFNELVGMLTTTTVPYMWIEFAGDLAAAVEDTNIFLKQAPSGFPGSDAVTEQVKIENFAMQGRCALVWMETVGERNFLCYSVHQRS